MSRKTILGISVIVIALIFTQGLLILGNFANAADPSTLKIFVGPTSVPADNKEYNIIVVQLQNSKGVPTRAGETTTISLSSSTTNIGTVDSSVVIDVGETQASAKFYSTYTPGSTTITATASGYNTVQSKITTVGPVPTTLAVYAYPPTIPANGEWYPAIVVQLQDSSGSPARAPIEGLPVTLSCSNTTVGEVDAEITIPGGSTFAVANLKADNVGQAAVTAVAQGYTSKQTNIATQQVGEGGENLKIYVSPPKINADGITYTQVIAVQLQNATGKLAQAPKDVIISLSSSDVNVGVVEPTITIPTGKNYAFAKFNSTFRSGSTTITAAASDYKSSQTQLSTVGPIPSKLAVYCVPSSLPGDGKAVDAIRVQLQDARGTPAKDPEGDITLYLFSSETDAGIAAESAVIPFGESHATANFISNCATNVTTITAQTSGYESGQAKINTYLVDEFTLNVTVTANPNAIYTGNESTVKAYVTFNGEIPAFKANLKFTSNKGGTFSAVNEEGNGYYSVIYTAPEALNNALATITATANKTGYNATTGTTKITLNPSSTQSGNVQLRVIQDNGDPVPEAKVSAIIMETDEVYYNGLTDAGGNLLLDNFLVRTYILQIEKDGYEAKNETITVTSGTLTPRTVTLPPLGFPWLLIIIIVAVAVGSSVGGFIYYKKYYKGEQEEEEDDDYLSTDFSLE